MPLMYAIVISSVALFVGMSVFSVLGYQLALRSLQRSDSPKEVSGTITGAIFALLGLLVALTFTSAISRFDARRQLVVEEANAIGTAYLRLDLLPIASRAELRERFKDYANSRAVLYDKLDDLAAAQRELAAASALQKEIWALAVAACSEAQDSSARMLLLPALNDMIDVVTTRTVAIQTHPPLLIWGTLFVLALVCAGFAGYQSGIARQRGLGHHLAFAALTASVIYVILDIHYPRFGLIRLDTANEVLVELAQDMD